jgi:E3 ubiquitin-protein ligase MARCH6
MLYRAWIHRPSELPVAWSGARLLEELASGLVVVAAIVVSFLSLLSFTDYMRVRWEIADLQRNLDDEDHNEQEAPVQEPVVEPPPPLIDDEEDEDDEVELHVAVDELLGLRGPLVNVARNVSWLVVFNAAYLGVFAFAPFAVGRAVSRGASRVLGHASDLDVVNATQVDPARAWASQVVRFVASGLNATANSGSFSHALGKPVARRERFGNWSRNLGNFADRLAARSTSAVPPPATLRLGDLGRVALGYAALGIVACLGRELFRSAPSALRAQLPVRALRRAERALDAAAAAAKVSMVLALKMVVLPTVLGAGLEIAIKPDLAQVRALGGGAAGAALARWVLGITFMLVVTVWSGVRVTSREGVASIAPMASRRWHRCLLTSPRRRSVDGVATRAPPPRRRRHVSPRRSPSYNCESNYIRPF